MVFHRGFCRNVCYDNFDGISWSASKVGVWWMMKNKNWLKKNHAVFPLFLIALVPFVAMAEAVIFEGLIIKVNFFYYIIVSGFEALLFFFGYLYGVWAKGGKKIGRL
jgi:hypothetical protein